LSDRLQVTFGIAIAAWFAIGVPPYPSGVGLFLGWIVQKRWLTLGAVLLCVIGLVVIPYLPVPLNTIWVVLPGILFAAITYEGGGTLLGKALLPRARLLYAATTGMAVLVLAVGVTFADANPRVLLGAVVIFIALWIAGLLPLAVKYRSLVRNRKAASGAHTS
jgi:hypothetical protein